MAFENTFMKPQAVQGKWLVIDGDSGTFIFPEYEEFVQTDESEEALDKLYHELTGGSTFYEMEHKSGWSARLSAPGYLDCTDWNGVYETEEEALKELEELYGEE